MSNYKSGEFEDSQSFSGRVHCTRYQISAGANAPAAPVLDPPLIVHEDWTKYVDFCAENDRHCDLIAFEQQQFS